MSEGPFILVIRVFAKLDDEESARQLAAAMVHRISSSGEVLKVIAKQYWKSPELFEATVSLRSLTSAAFQTIVDTLGDRWSVHDISDDCKWALWNHPEGSFFDSAVCWAHIECFPGSAIDRDSPDYRFLESSD